MPRGKYLTKDEFSEFRENEFSHLQKSVARIKGKLDVLVPLVIATIGLVVTVLVLLVVL